jgi:hypothetical protein
MQHLQYGRKILAFDESDAALMTTVVTEKALTNEDEATFTHRLLGKYKGRRGTIEIVFKRGSPDYAILTFPESEK